MSSSGRELGPITLSAMGSFFFGGRVVREQNGETVHGDHGYAQYYVPANSRSLPLIMWHGLGQSGKTWESTPDGRPGFWQLFTSHDWPVYIIDQPRRGRAGRGCPERAEDVWPAVPPTELESVAWGTFRLGTWTPPQEPTFFAGLSFPTDQCSIEQFFRQQTPNTGSEPFPDAGHREALGGTVAELARMVGPSILMTHSHSGQYGWVSAMRAPEVIRSVIAIEPGEFCYPSDAPPEDVPTSNELLRQFMEPQLVSPEDFDQLTRIPILILMGDNISRVPVPNEFGVELWRMVSERAKQMVEIINRRGGNATYIELPMVGLRGNTHFPMSDLNNVEVVDYLESWMSKNGLDDRESPHKGPQLAHPTEAPLSVK
ncbi:alpha/beta hydrolase [Rhodococcus opacus]|uniref:alpha/beta hydrolase n=1 Tax=Rhodococcus opacus TaxID=37919 RepID=UPI001C486BCC|nr:alpha/beta fold hydrolase [Rhodococcus opacus]MBV6756647.1 alpha/beta fold hydrolase [Rhodococcus opacus]